MLLFIQVFQNHRSFREHHQRSWSSLAFRPVPHTTPKPRWRSGSFRSCSVLYSQPRGGGEGAVRATPVVPTYLLSPCVPPSLRLHRVPCVRRGSQVTPASYTEPVVRLGGGGWGGVGGQHILAIRKTNSSKREATLKPSSECSFVFRPQPPSGLSYPSTSVLNPPECQWGHSASHVGLLGQPDPTEPRGTWFWKVE